jgi:hypothetical protein
VTIGVSTKLGTSPPTLSGTLVLTKGVDRLGSALTRLVGDWLSRTSVDDKYTEKDGTKGNDQYHADRETRLHVEEAGADSLLVAMTSHSAFTDHLGRGGAEQKWTRDQQAQFSIAIAADGTLSAKMVSAKTRDEQAAFAALPDAMVRRLELRPTGDLFADFFFKLGSTLSATFKKQ